MRINIKKVLACICCLTMAISVCAIPASSEDDAAEAAETAEEEAEPADEDFVPRTDEEVMADMELSLIHI